LPTHAHRAFANAEATPSVRAAIIALTANASNAATIKTAPAAMSAMTASAWSVQAIPIAHISTPNAKRGIAAATHASSETLPTAHSATTATPTIAPAFVPVGRV